mmetsp:Transcript_112944/g.205274  ORF Transcript_112944/g.205274 Transcript_112944/m.205274 type:complete len:384 (-) Transcript_112944:54-1205(-)
MLRSALTFACLACASYGLGGRASAQGKLDPLTSLARMLLAVDAEHPSMTNAAACFLPGRPAPSRTRTHRLTRSDVLGKTAAATLAAAAGSLASSTQATAIPPPELLAKAPDFPGAVKEPSVLYTPPSIKGTSTAQQIALAKYLKKIGAKFYGTYWCPFCNEQRQMFGAGGVRQLPYVECAEDGYQSATSECRAKAEVRAYPTWEVKGKFYNGLKTLQDLQAISGFDSSVKFPEYVRPGAKPRPPPPPGGYKPPAVAVASTSTQLALAKHLKSSGAKFYGTYWCRYCDGQRQNFGAEATKLLPYVECASDGYQSARATCDGKQVNSFPTWEIGGSLYAGMQSLEELAKLSGFNDPKFSLATSTEAGLGAQCDDCVVGGGDKKKI